MSKRHDGQSYIDWLKSLGCVLYLPLATDGDLKDRISGNDAVVTGCGSLRWDSTEQMYLFSMPPSTSKSVLTLETSLAAIPSWTIMCKAKKTATGGTHSILVNGSYMQAINGIYGTQQSITMDSARWTQTDKFQYAFAYRSSDTHRLFVIDGATVNDSYSSTTGVSATSSVNIGTVGSWGSAGSVYMGEVYLFNTTLDLATIRKIQGYE